MIELVIVSRLLEYPDAALWQHQQEMFEAIAASKNLSKEDAHALGIFLRDLTAMDPLDAQAQYSELFDRGRATSLLLFEHVHGESRDRGQAMVDLLAQYEQHGLQLNSRELPDHLPLYLEYLANLLTAGDTKPVLRALKRMLAMRHYKRAETVDGKVDTRALEEVGLTEAQAQEMYRYLAIANYEDRFVVPSSHRELAREAFPEKNGCGFTFGDGCHGSDTKFNLFNSRRIDAIDVTSKTEPHP